MLHVDGQCPGYQQPTRWSAHPCHDLTPLASAGTPLGDPIEVGALGAALSCQDQTSPHAVAMASVKSCYGHTEGAAGLTGALMALQSSSGSLQVRHEGFHACLHLQSCSAAGRSNSRSASSCAASRDAVRQLFSPRPKPELPAQAPIMHLRSLNSYVEAALGDWGRLHSLAGQAPRSAGPCAQPGLAAGTSSFGMSGVNAHLLAAASPGQQQQEASQPLRDLHWQRQRHWPLPPSHAALSSALLCSRESAAFAVPLGSPALAYLRECRVHGCSTLPGSAGLEIAAAACATLHQAPLLLVQAVLAQAHVLGEQEATLCHISCAAGSVQLATSAGATLASASVQHLVVHQGHVAAARSRPAWLWLRAGSSTGSATAVAALAAASAQLCAVQAALHLPNSRIQPCSHLLTACKAAAAYPSAPEQPQWAAAALNCSPYSTGTRGSAALRSDSSPVAQLLGVTCKPAPAGGAAAAQEAWQLHWQPVQPSMPAMHKAIQRLLLLSNAPVSLASICRPEAAAGCTALSVVQAEAQQLPMEVCEVVVSSPAHLALLLSCVQADHAFCVQQPAAGELSTGVRHDALACVLRCT